MNRNATTPSKTKRHWRNRSVAGAIVSCYYGLVMAVLTTTTASPSPFGHDDRSFAISRDDDTRVGWLADNKRHRRVSEARLLLDDIYQQQQNEEETLMDTTIYSSSSSSTTMDDNDDDDDASCPSDLRQSHHHHLPSSSWRIRLPRALRDSPSLDPLCVSDDDDTASKPRTSSTIVWTEESLRNLEHRMAQQQQQQQRYLKTGTTIAGVCGYDTSTKRPFVVLGADTRATAGRMVADKQCQKIHCLAQNIWACGAGTSADLDMITRQCRYSLALRALTSTTVGNHRCRVVWKADDEPDRTSSLESTAHHTATMATACRYLRDTLYEAGGSVGANLIVGGVDEGTGVPHIRAIHPHGSMDSLSYAALGSGGLAAMAVIESRYRSDISLEEGIQMVKEAIVSGIQNDMGSGSQVDLCVITTATTTTNTGAEKLYRRVLSNYTRAVVPEQELAPLEATTGSSTDPRTTFSTPGVNGFGNYPYSVRSQRLILPSRIHEEQERLETWDDFLGFTQHTS